MPKPLVIAIALFVGAAPAGAAPSRTDRCAASDTLNFEPAEMLQMEDDFRAHLPVPDRTRLDEALPRAPNGRIAQCVARDGASCDDYAYVVAFGKTGLMERFVATICPPRQ
jgi:hypothetical protein